MLVLLALMAWSSFAVARQESCDPGLPVSEANPLHYKLRGAPHEHTDRCEGIYIQEVGSTTLLIASLTAFFEDYDLSSEEPLLVEWAGVGEGAVRLRAQGIRHKLYYRMDTVRPSGATTYTWPTNILAALHIERADIGVAGWTQAPVGDVKRNVYLPLWIRQQAEPPGPEGYQVVLLPGRELTEVFVSLATVDEEGNPETFLQDGVALEYGYYPAGRGIMIPISGLAAPGVYYLELGATLRGGGGSSVELWFYHPGD